MPETVPPSFLKSREACVSYAVANGNTIWVRASAADTGGAYTLIEGDHVVGTGPPLHTHDSEDETFWMVDGSYSIQAGDEEFAAVAGDLVFFLDSFDTGFSAGATDGCSCFTRQAVLSGSSLNETQRSRLGAGR